MEDFKEILISLINSKMAELSFEQVFYTVKDVYRDLYENYQKYLLDLQRNKINNIITEEEKPIEENKEEEK
jgi:hypothetical protein